MNKYSTFIACMFIMMTRGYGQCTYNANQLSDTVESIINCDIYTQYSSSNEQLTAREQITLKPGFDVKANTSYVFDIKLDNSIVAPANYEGSENVVTPTANSGGNSSFSTAAPYIPGSIQGTLNVSPGGTVNYDIPIMVSPGTRGMQPSLGIKYLGQSDNSGELGYGWCISGISTIKAVSKNVYYDGYDSNDPINDAAYELDGQRLIPYASSKFNELEDSGTIYYFTLENDPYTSVVLGESGNFTVITKDGMVTTYNGNCNIYDNNWYISRVTDVDGNYIQYNYFSPNDRWFEYHISEIDYTGNGTTKAPYNSILFYYNNKNDTNGCSITGWSLALPITNSVSLSSIKVMNGGSVSKDYEFSYFEDPTDNYTKLNQIALTADGVSYNPTIINWGASNYTDYSTSKKSSLGSPSAHNFIYTGDVDGDGLTDFVVLSGSNLGGGSYTISTTISSTGISYSFTTKDTIMDIQLVDWNNDGKDELMIHHANSTVSFIYDYVTCYNFGTGGWTLLQDTAFLPLPNPHQYAATGLGSSYQASDGVTTQTSSYYYKHEYADINGDGLIERITSIIPTDATLADQNITWVSNAFGFNSTGPNDVRPGIDDIKYLDIDGDGEMELLVHATLSSSLNQMPIAVPSYQIVKFNNGFGLSLFHVRDPNYYYTLYDTLDLSAGFKVGGFPVQPLPKDVYTGDFNGDGFTDLLVYNEGNSHWDIFYSNGEGYTNPVRLFSNIKITDGIYAVLIDDINNDGKDDIILSVDNSNSSSSSTNTLHLFTSNGLTFTENTITVTGGGPLVLKMANIQTGNPLGIPATTEPKQLLWGSKDNDYYGFLSFNQQLGASHAVTGITDGNNNTSTISYGYKSTGTNSFPTYPPIYGFSAKPKCIMEPLFLPTQIKTNNNAGDTISNTTYTFTNGLTYPYGKGFLGFTGLVAVESVTNTNSTTTYLPIVSDGGTTNYIYMYPSATSTTRNGSLLTSVSTTITAVPSGAEPSDTIYKQFYPLTTQTITTDGATGGTTTYTVNLSAYPSCYDYYLGRILQDTITTSDGWNIVSQFNYEMTYGNVNAFVSRLDGITTTKTSSTNATPVQDVTTYGYDDIDGGNSLRLKTTSKQNSITSTIKSWDDYGNPTSVTTSVTDAFSTPARTTITTYDDQGRFPISTTDGMGYKTTYSYRPGDGALLSKTDPNGLTTKTVYSSGGNSFVATTTLPDGNTNTTTLGWNATAFYAVTNAVSNGNTITKYYDCNNLQVGQTSFGFNGKPLTTTNSYNTALRQLTSTQYPDGSTIGYTNYDNWGRVGTVSGTGVNKTYTYRGASTQETDKNMGSTATKTVDALGNVTTVTGTNGEVDYAYFGSGKVASITTGGHSTTMTYDTLQNPKNINDPNVGTINYVYNGFGQLGKQTDTLNQITMCTYDNDGRLTLKTEPKESVTYKYYDTPGNVGLLNYITRGGVTETYTYDALERCTGVVTQGANTPGGSTVSYTSGFTYDASTGRLATQSYPTGLTVGYQYDSYGNVSEIDNNAPKGGMIWQAGTVNSLNQWLTYKQGNGITTTVGYDGTTHLPNSIQAGTVCNQSYAYNANGQMNSRTETGTWITGGGSITENYHYDALDRLTRDSIGTNPTHIYGYDITGNITNTSVAGAYSYKNTAHPNAVSSVAGIGGTPSATAITTTATYNTDNKVATIDNLTYRDEFTYGVDGNRFRVDFFNYGSGSTKALQGSKVYIGNSEFGYDAGGSPTYTRTIINAPSGVCAVYQDSAKAFWYVHTDFQGSWLAITNQAGAVTNRYSYDAWGRPRNVADWTLKTISITNALTNLNAFQPRFDRGYTGHEQMAGFGLINMNGRLYDPYLQRFLSPDIIVQDPSNGQNYNRYSYCLNNPLRYTDPSGWYEVGEDIPNYILNPYGSDGGTGDAFSDVTPVGTPIPEVVCTATRTPQLYNISGSLMQILGDFANNNVPSYTPSSNTTVPNKLGTLSSPGGDRGGQNNGAGNTSQNNTSGATNNNNNSNSNSTGKPQYQLPTLSHNAEEGIVALSACLATAGVAARTGDPRFDIVSDALNYSGAAAGAVLLYNSFANQYNKGNLSCNTTNIVNTTIYAGSVMFPWVGFISSFLYTVPTEVNPNIYIKSNK